MKIRHLFISPGHNYFGHHGHPAGHHSIVEVTEIECVAGSGIKGDRFFGFKEDYKGQITFFADEVFEDVCDKLGVCGKSPSITRRNVITKGLDLNSLIGQQFEIQGMRFEGVEECRPCYWMNEAIAPSAEQMLQGRGGLRARILTNGKLHVDKNFNAVVLAGGKSSRMGCDKAFLEIGGEALIARQIKLAREMGAAEVFISGRRDADYSAFGCRVLHDKFVAAGPLAGIEHALKITTSPLLLVLAVDLPAMNAKFLHRLAMDCSGKLGAIPRLSGNVEPLAAFYPKSAYILAAAQLEAGCFAVKDFAEQCVQSGIARFIELETDVAHHFVNWNSSADLPNPTELLHERF